MKTLKIKAPDFRAYSPRYVRKKLKKFLGYVEEQTSFLEEGKQIKIFDFKTIHNFNLFRAGLTKRLLQDTEPVVPCHKRIEDEANLTYTIKEQYKKN